MRFVTSFSFTLRRRVELTFCRVNGCHGEGFRDPIDILLAP
jgi:hypothetical protein